jgi:hypothetical protein
MQLNISITGLDSLSRKYDARKIAHAEDRGLDAAVLQTEAESKRAATEIIYAKPESRPSASAQRAAIGQHQRGTEAHRRVSAIVKGAGRRTGAYRASLTTGGTGNVKRRGSHSRTFGSNLSYAATIEKGSRAHIIRPKTKKALAFWGGSGMVVVKSVKHPGTKPRNVIATAARQGQPRIVAAFKRAYGQALGGS